MLFMFRMLRIYRKIKGDSRLWRREIEDNTVSPLVYCIQGRGVVCVCFAFAWIMFLMLKNLVFRSACTIFAP